MSTPEADSAFHPETTPPAWSVRANLLTATVTNSPLPSMMGGRSGSTVALWLPESEALGHGLPGLSGPPPAGPEGDVVVGISHDVADFDQYLELAATFAGSRTRVTLGTTETVAEHPSPSGQTVIVIDGPRHQVSHVRGDRILTFLSAHADKISYKPVGR